MSGSSGDKERAAGEAAVSGCAGGGWRWQTTTPPPAPPPVPASIAGASGGRGAGPHQLGLTDTAETSADLRGDLGGAEALKEPLVPKPLRPQNWPGRSQDWGQGRRPSGAPNTWSGEAAVQGAPRGHTLRQEQEGKPRVCRSNGASEGLTRERPEPRAQAAEAGPWGRGLGEP